MDVKVSHILDKSGEKYTNLESGAKTLNSQESAVSPCELWCEALGD